MEPELRRLRRSHTTINEEIDSLEYSMAIDIHCFGEIGLPLLFAWNVIQSMDACQRAVVDGLLKTAFESGVREGRARQQYNEDDD